MAEPWFRLHANISKRKVTARLMAHASLSKFEAIGHLAVFWGAISQHCPGGDISDIPISLLEEWAEWTGTPGLFAAFVREKHTMDGKINDYDEYSGKLEEYRARERERKRKRKEDADAAKPPIVTRSAHVPAESTRKDDGIPAEGVRNSGGTRRDETRRDEKEEKHVTSQNVTGEYSPEFELIWNALPRRTGTNNKQKAYRQYLARLAAKESFTAMHDGAMRYNLWAVSTGTVGTRGILQASTFLGRDKHYLEPYDLPTTDERGETPFQVRAKVLYRLYVDHGFARLQTEDAYKLIVKDLAASGTITEPRRFWAEVKVIKPWAWMPQLRTTDQHKAITRIAQDLPNVPPVLELTPAQGAA